MKRKIQLLKLENGETSENVSNCGTGVDDRISALEDIKDELEAALVQLEIAQVCQTKLNENQIERDQLKQRVADELKIEQAKLRMRSKFEEKDVEEKAKQEKNATSKTKLSRPETTKLKGTHLDWMKFWGEFDVKLERSTLFLVTKFSYLKEFVDPKVRILIDDLPFTSEGYNQAKVFIVQNMEDQVRFRMLRFKE